MTTSDERLQELEARLARASTLKELKLIIDEAGRVQNEYAEQRLRALRSLGHIFNGAKEGGYLKELKRAIKKAEAGQLSLWRGWRTLANESNDM